MDLIDAARYIGALLLVLSLIGLAGLGIRRYGVPGMAKAKGVRRLSVIETLIVDSRHKLFLLRRDGAEHLVLIGPQSASVIEAGVKAPAATDTAP